ncbi:MAG: DNA gyrase subunit B [Clostridia bacterium]|nr:DNA gyrase subunit B [Clostridia bacterium]
MAKTSYKAEDIKILEGLDAVRLRPGMYIGTTGVKGLHHILWEIVDNAVDEAANGFANKIEVKLYNDGSASVEDNGRGIPTDIHSKAGVSGVEVVFTQLHAGGKFDADNYSYSGGLHGVGASVTNALSEWLTVEVYKDTVYKMDFHSYLDKETGKVKSGVPKAPLKNTKEKTKKKGSFIRFLPDKRVFETTEFSVETILKRLKELAFLNKGLEIKFYDEHTDFSRTYKFDGGITDFVKYLNEGKSSLYNEPLSFSATRDNIYVEIAIQHTDAYTDSVYSYVNNIPTGEGGMHETGFRSGLTRSLNDYARERNILKEKDDNLLGDDFKEGLTAIISIKMQNVQFEGQTKTKLGNPEARPAVEGVTVNELELLMKNKKLGKVFDSIINKAMGAAKVRLAAKKAKEIARASKSIESQNLVGKLAACSGRKAELNELFIVEGDSAGGSAKQARMRQYQAILPLRGKPLNVEKKKLDQILQNEEIRTIISALGTGIGSEFDIEGLKYHKVIILSDADQDGAHIRAILLTFFFRYMRDLIKEGHVYVGMPPLYKVHKGKVEEYAYDDKELQEKIAKVGRGYQIQRYKGLGEMNPSQLWDTTLNPETRSLMQVTIEDAAEADKMITVLMGDEVAERKKYIFEHANFNKEDKFAKIKRD